MMLRIIRGTEPVEISTITILIYGYPGAGKTSLAFTAADPLVLDFDQGAHRSEFRDDSVPIETWADVESMDLADLAPYKTVVVDTVGRCLDRLAEDIMTDPKMKQRDGQMTLKGWGALKSRFAIWVKGVRNYGLDVVLTSHLNEQRDGDDLIVRPDIQGGSYTEIFKLADGVAYLASRSNARTLAWDPTDKFIGKNPGRFPAEAVPDINEDPTYLARKIDQLKSHMGQLSAASAEVATVVKEWQGQIAEAKSATALTKLAKDAREQLEGSPRRQVGGLVAMRAKELKLAWDKEADKYKKAA
jgi:hypothetical protein